MGRLEEPWYGKITNSKGAVAITVDPPVAFESSELLSVSE